MKSSEHPRDLGYYYPIGKPLAKITGPNPPIMSKIEPGCIYPCA